MKIALSNLKKIIDVCTKKEIDLIIYIGQFQDVYGTIKGIDYKDVISTIGICKSTFYKLLYALETKGIIEINYINDYGFWEVKIVDNEFKDTEDYKKGYLKLNFAVLHSKAFYEMTKSEKVIIINLLRINNFRKSKIKITLNRIAEWTGKSIRSVLKFVETLKRVFNVIKNGNLCLIDCLFGFGNRGESESDILNKQLILYRLKKAKSESSDGDIKDVCTLFKQYGNSHDTNGLLSAVDTVLEKFGTLVPAYINKLLNVAD